MKEQYEFLVTGIFYHFPFDVLEGQTIIGPQINGTIAHVTPGGSAISALSTNAIRGKALSVKEVNKQWVDLGNFG